MNDKPIAAGKSSFDLIDFAKLVDVLDIEKGITFLDVACGAGAYTLALADHGNQALPRGSRSAPDPPCFREDGFP